jgi:EAL domain-containing protein (putative c-di-GMP-specific phosphodiesterase class I)
MYLAKEQGGGVEQYDVDRDRNSTDRLVMVGELRRALTGDELEVHYQPKADLRTGRVDGVEALVRWRHPERGLVPPDEFVPLAESCGLVELLTARVLDAAVAQLAAWHAQGLELSVAVNVSVRDLAGGLLVDRVTASLLRHGVPACRLQLEVTEGSLFADSTGAASTLRELDELGVALSLDDFGTGYSSLGHLRRLPVQELKIDRSFVQRMGDDARDRAIVRSVVDLAEGLGMRVVAEGVEDLATWQALRELGCDVAQGWYVCRPQPADVLTPWLHARARAFAAG